MKNINSTLRIKSKIEVLQLKIICMFDKCLLIAEIELLYQIEQLIK